MEQSLSSTTQANIRNRRHQFGKTRSLSQYAVSLPSQPEDVSGIHVRDDRFNFFQRGRDLQAQHSKHHFTSDELRILETYESADVLPSHTEVYRQWLEDVPPRGVAETWNLVIFIGLIIGTLSFIMKECCESFQIFSNPFMGEYIDRGDTYRLWMYYATMSSTLSAISAFVCVYFCPWAAGSGLPELIGILNGCVVRNMLSFKTLVFKILSTLLTVLSSLPVGFEGPMIHIGAMVAAMMTRPIHNCSESCPRCRIVPQEPFGEMSPLRQAIRSSSSERSESGCCGRHVCRYRDCKERHDLICMGAAAGMASAFSAPIAGLLFAMEEISSFWTTSLTWQTFFCCILARSVTEIGRSIVATIKNEKGDNDFIGLEFSESALFDMKENIRLNLLIAIPTIILGVIGGLGGALFIIFHLKAARLRRRILGKISRPEYLNIIKVIEPMIVALISSAVVMGSLRFFICKDVNHTAEVVSLHEGKYLRFHGFQCDKPLVLEYEDSKITQSGEYHEMATLVFGSWEQMIRNLLSRKTGDIFSWQSMLILLVFFFICSSWASLCSLASGLLIPQLVIGALYGRIFGIILVELFGKLEWMDPGVFALLGAASFLSGTSRLPITSVVMLIEMTNDINMSLLVMIVVILAKFIGGTLTHPLYHTLSEFKCIPHLDSQIHVSYNGKRVNLELFKAADVMATPVKTVNVNESVQFLANLLLDTNHGGFPVVISEFGFKRTFLGVINRLELVVILTKTINFSPDELGREDIEKIRISYPEYSSNQLRDTTGTNEILNYYAEDPKFANLRINLLQYINTSSYSVPSQFSLQRVYRMFRTLGARHLVVTDQQNQVMGIITRKDLLAFRVDEKIGEIIRQKGGRRRVDFTSPRYIGDHFGEDDIRASLKTDDAVYDINSESPQESQARPLLTRQQRISNI